MKTILLESTSSTNEYIKKFLPLGEDVALCAVRQTAGRGTKGRSFLSEEGGVYCSFLNFYRDFPASEAFRIMAHAAVSVCRTAKFFGAEPSVKWPNDIFAKGRKLAGILIENALFGEKISCSIVGIGLNVANDVSALGGIAISLAEAAGKPLSPKEVRPVLIDNFSRKSDLQEYLSFVRFWGKEVRVTEGERCYTAIAERVLEDGRLEIKEGGACPHPLRCRDRFEHLRGQYEIRKKLQRSLGRKI